MINSIPYTTYHGSAAQLCRKGDAVEFIQPWYTPISTTPANTGMAIGGIGSTFTLTPQGQTPNFSSIPGIFIDCSEEDIHFNDFYCSVMAPLSLDNIALGKMDEVSIFLKFYPALFNGKTLDLTEASTALESIKQAAISGSFYADNRDSFQRWNIELNSKTRNAIKVDERALETQLLVLVDFFNGLLINTSAQSLALTAGEATRGEVDAVPGEQIDYKALYPMAHFDYQSFGDIAVSRKVVSPVVKDDKVLCSLPMHWNHFSLSNQGSETKLVTLVQPLNNLIGSTYRKGRDGIQDSACTLTQNPISQHHESVQFIHDNQLFNGVSQSSQSGYAADIEGEVIYGVQVARSLVESGKVTVTTKRNVYTTKRDKVVKAALETGRTNDHFDYGIYTKREALASIVTVQVELNPGESVDVRFAQLHDHKKISLNGWESEKAYTQFYSNENTANTILNEWLPQLESIEKRIVDQQSDYLAKAKQSMSDSAAVKHATMAMNTLSFLAESTVWDAKDKFLVKECVDYPFFNSLDVYFYGSFSLLYLLPELDGSVMKEFANAILAADDTTRRFWEYEDKPHAELVDAKYEGVRAITGAVIHDLGSPFDIQPDAYTWHNVKEWKDLAPKYILMVYRHYQRSGDVEIVKACWEAIGASLDYLGNLIEEGDTLPLTRGTDDTFDNLSSHGVSIYCGSLWVAGLKAASEMASMLGHSELSAEWRAQSDAALVTLEQGLWDEKQGYYHFFVTPIQAKHLTGVEYQALEALGIAMTGNPLSDMVALNQYLDSVDAGSPLSKLEQRQVKKKQLKHIAPQAFTEAFDQLVADSDNSFGDALLADSYLKLIGLEGIFDASRIERSLDYILARNFESNSPKLGVANMVLADGAPHDAFQAQDVWIGVQFSVATALRLAGKTEQAEALMSTVYDALYELAKIPFAAPEGFNCSVAVSAEDLADQFDLALPKACEWLTALKTSGCLLSDGRVHPSITKDRSEFFELVNKDIDAASITKLHPWLLSTGLKYTAGRYFRPGMIFSYLY
jgi:uncharacterized protein (DUF608 family)